MNWLGWNGFGATLTCRRDWLPGEIEGHYIHKKTESSDKKNVARFFNPVFPTKKTDKLVEKRTGDNGEDVENVIRKAFKCFHVSFQSTS